MPRICKDCGRKKTLASFPNLKHRPSEVCKECLAAPKKDERLTLAFFDSWPHCCHGMFTDSPCLEKPTWRVGQWRTCDKHRGPGMERERGRR